MGSDLDTTLDLSPSNSSPSFSNMVYVSIQSDEVEEIWFNHANRVLNDTTGLQAVDTFHLFARLFHVRDSSLCQQMGRANVLFDLITDQLHVLHSYYFLS